MADLSLGDTCLGPWVGNSPKRTGVGSDVHACGVPYEFRVFQRGVVYLSSYPPSGSVCM